MRLVTVGTGTVVPDPNRGSSCYWVEHEGTRLVVDCGSGALPGLARARLPWGDVDHILVSHFHADHIVEIPALIFALRYGLEIPRTAPLEVWGPAGTRRVFEAWAVAFGSWVVDPGFQISIHEVVPGTPSEIGALVVRSAPTAHTDESLGYRLEADGPVLGYTGDTGPSDELARFFYGVDLLLAECSLPEELVADNHLSPERLARLAVDAGVDRLAVTHVYPQLRRLDVPALIRAGGFDGEVIMVHDGLELDI
jgi:ribonuclease BN (tRNA processing enzyme)